MIALLSFLLIIIFSVIVIKIGATALKLTGLSREVANFEAQSAFSGVGFTTSESESIVYHPLRRQIIRILMLLGSAGLTTAIATLVLTFVGQSKQGALTRLGGLVVGIFILYFIFRSRWADRILTRFFERILIKKYGRLKIYDYEKLFGLQKGYSISKFTIKEKSWLAGKTLKESKLYYEGILVVGIIREINGKTIFIGAPKGNNLIKANDILICYGKEEILTNLAQRIKGVRGERQRKKILKKVYKIKQAEKQEKSIV
ncbi:TrkA C-terminal domain-containing protein [bacterium]|nr:TrkA C-terminal domain-containing protein [bacterium]